MAVHRSSTPGKTRNVLILIALIFIGTAVVLLVPKRVNLTEFPKKDPGRYQQMVSAFTIAATKLKVGDTTKGSETDLSITYKRPTELVPEEPAGWANLGLWYLRSDKPADALPFLTKAKELAPQN